MPVQFNQLINQPTNQSLAITLCNTTRLRVQVLVPIIHQHQHSLLSPSPEFQGYCIPLNSPVHSRIRNDKRRHNVQHLPAASPEGVENSGVSGSGEGALAVGGEGVGGDALGGGAAYHVSIDDEICIGMCLFIC